MIYFLTVLFFRHYANSYNYLLEIRVVDTNALEIRTIAGFINYKQCRILFAVNLPRDAINHFKTHIERFKNRSGFQELSFEHYAWLLKQYSAFGDLFDQAVKLGLPGVQTQHPGIYYQQAAQYAILRKKSCQELCTVSNWRLYLIKIHSILFFAESCCLSFPRSSRKC